jgi:hypothetical protein
LFLPESKEIIIAYGHENVSATHQTTLEITKEKCLSKKGNCVIAVAADKAIDDLRLEFKKRLRNDQAKLVVRIDAGGINETVNAVGDSHLILAHPTDIVVRKSPYICKRTLAIRADKCASELSRDLVNKLRDPKQQVKITLAINV